MRVDPSVFRGITAVVKCLRTGKTRYRTRREGETAHPNKLVKPCRYCRGFHAGRVTHAA